MNLYQRICSSSLRKLRCRSIFKKYSKTSGPKSNQNNSPEITPATPSTPSASTTPTTPTTSTTSTTSAIDFKKLGKAYLVDVMLNATNTGQNLFAVQERALLAAYEQIRMHLVKRIKSLFFRSRRFLDHVEHSKRMLQSPRSGRNNRFEWSLPCDTAKTAHGGVRGASLSFSGGHNLSHGVWNSIEQSSNDPNCCHLSDRFSDLSDASTRTSGDSMSTENSSGLSESSFDLRLDLSSMKK